jgi:hypothetical protein
MNLLKFWPTEADCLACIKPEAENPSDAVFLAVHQEMRLLRKSFSSDSSVPEKKSQRQFINDFLKDDPSGRVIVPILGESGIGKSHLVRWLDVQLRQRDDTEKRHVIRIPKSSSLKSVLGRILNGLEGPRYKNIRSQLQSAREQMDDISAKLRVRAELLSAIQRNYEAASARQAKAKESGDKLGHTDMLWLKHGDPRKLPALFDDPATQKLFLVGTKERPGIISELAKHVTKDTTESDAPRRQFETADFEIPKALEKDISEAGVIAASYLRNHLLKTTSSKSLDEAVDLLNSIVDDAIAPLATPQDTSLAELFYEVRRQLLADGRELVLLVEDFAVLAGVQKALLDAIIREGEVGGKREACMIRTALAVTDGYFGNLDTVKTRAVHGWWIESGENDKESDIENQIGDFVATYVNAARMGAERLKEFYGKSANAGKRAPNAIEVIGVEEDESSLLDGFGKSANGYSMFPFNQAAIRTIADWKLRRKGRLRFHPRSIISEVILPVLKDNRIDYARNTFPPDTDDSFLGYPILQISPDLRAEVNKKLSASASRTQYYYLLHFWGDRPDAIKEAAIPKVVFKAFGLESLGDRIESAQPTQLKPIVPPGGAPSNETEVVAAPLSSRPDADQEPPQVKQFLERINAWREGNKLEQKDANKIRTLLRDHLMNAINWEAVLLKQLKPIELNHQSIYIPRSSGNIFEPKDAFVCLSEEESFKSSEAADKVFFIIRALIRYDHFRSWSYPLGDTDYNVIANFIDEQLESATEWIAKRYHGIFGNPIASLVQALLWQARILNIEQAHRSDDVSQVSSVFSNSSLHMSVSDDDDWNAFLSSNSDSRQFLVKELIARVAAFQGDGDKPFAVDLTQILPVIQEFRETWEISERFPDLPSSPSDEHKRIRDATSKLFQSGSSKVKSRCDRIAKYSQQIVSELGVDYDKNELIHDLVEVCDLSEKHGLGGTVSIGQVRKLAEEFRTTKAKEVGEQVAAITNGKDLGTQMSAIAKLDIETLTFMKTFAETCAQFLKEKSSKATGQIMTFTDDVVESSKSDIDDILVDLENSAMPYVESIS